MPKNCKEKEKLPKTPDVRYRAADYFYNVPQVTNTQTTAGGHPAHSHAETPEDFQEKQTEMCVCVCGLAFFPGLGHLLVLLNNTTHSHWKPTTLMRRFLLRVLVIGLI